VTYKSQDEMAAEFPSTKRKPGESLAAYKKRLKREKAKAKLKSRKKSGDAVPPKGPGKAPVAGGKGTKPAFLFQRGK
jgi:hypothetical protein